ncbi:hypothetical protein SAMN05421685_101156 [Thalassovita mediterranea]|nr:hypothetical protein SAMN05421685_101156 [Thalassovita mediterranea]
MKRKSMIAFTAEFLMRIGCNLPLDHAIIYLVHPVLGDPLKLKF